LGGQIGKGEFGAVYEIESLERQPPPSYSDDETIMIEDGILNNSSCTTTTRSNSKSDSITSKNSRESLRESTSAGMPRRNSDNGGPVGASMTLPLNADLFVNNETTLDAYIRRKIDVIKECGEVNFKPPHIQSDTIINLSSDEESSGSGNGDTNNNNAQNQNHQSHRHRRHALKIKDCKGQMIKRAGDVENNDNFDGYAVKLVREDIPSDKKKRVAVVDMASEAKLLSALSHPNIIQIRGILGYVERPDGRYGIIMDKLRLTLQEQIQTWSQLNKEENFTKGVPTPRPLLEHVPKWMLVRQQEKEKLQLYQKQNEFFLDRLDACCDVAQAMQYLHSKRIIYRDLKPENVGLTNENWVVYDFGLSKELKVRDRINNNIYNDTDTDDSDQYRNTTGLTGSRLFMAPEVARCKAYGFSADVYSYSILFWECMSLKEVFPDMTMNKHFQLVIKRGRRPSTMEHIIPNELNTMMIQSWSSNPKHRPSFISICSILDKEIQKRANENNNNSSNNNSSLTFLPWVHNDNDDDQDDDDDDYNEFEDYYSDNNSSYDNDNDNDDDDDDDDDHIKSNNARTAAANTGTATRPTIDRGYHSDHDHSSFSQRREQRRNKFLKHFKFDKFTGGSGSIVPEPLKNIPEQIAAKTLEGSSKLSAMMN
jgi:serine/threonine protein kinase